MVLQTIRNKNYSKNIYSWTIYKDTIYYWARFFFYPGKEVNYIK